MDLERLYEIMDYRPVPGNDKWVINRFGHLCRRADGQPISIYYANRYKKEAFVIADGIFLKDPEVPAELRAKLDRTFGAALNAPTAAERIFKDLSIVRS